MKVLILGAGGFIGKKLLPALRAQGHTVVAGSLRKPLEAAAFASGCDTVINLAGESVAQRWTPQVKAAIRESRTTLPAQFLQALSQQQERPKAYISASAIGYYGTSLSAIYDEESPAGTGFLADVCVAWEQTAATAASLGMTTAFVRTGLVCGTDGGALGQLLPIFRFGLGGPVGNGQQWYSWIHIDDVVGIYLHAVNGTTGVLNATAPEPVRNAEFTKALGYALSRPTIFPVPPIAIKMLLGEGATVVIDGQRVIPKRVIESGYAFRYPSIMHAFTSLLKKRKD